MYRKCVFATSTHQVHSGAHRIVTLTVYIWCCHFIRLLISNCIPTCDATYIYTCCIGRYTHTHAHICKINSTNKWDGKKCSFCHLYARACVCVCVRFFFWSQLALFSTYIFNNKSRYFKIQIVKQDMVHRMNYMKGRKWKSATTTTTTAAATTNLFVCLQNLLPHKQRRKNLVNIFRSNFIYRNVRKVNWWKRFL